MEFGGGKGFVVVLVRGVDGFVVGLRDLVDCVVSEVSGWGRVSVKFAVSLAGEVSCRFLRFWSKGSTYIGELYFFRRIVFGVFFGFNDGVFRIVYRKSSSVRFIKL